jgi:hypothetical protein
MHENQDILDILRVRDLDSRQLILGLQNQGNTMNTQNFRFCYTREIKLDA